MIIVFRSETGKIMHGILLVKKVYPLDQAGDNGNSLHPKAVSSCTAENVFKKSETRMTARVLK